MFKLVVRFRHLHPAAASAASNVKFKSSTSIGDVQGVRRNPRRAKNSITRTALLRQLRPIKAIVSEEKRTFLAS